MQKKIETVHPDLLKVFRFICPGKTADSVAKWKGKKLVQFL